MKAKIKDKKEIAPGTLFVTFDLLGQEVDFKPGKYFFVTLLSPPFSEPDSKTLTHHFSIVNSPTEKGIIQMATRIRDTAFKKSLAAMPVGSDVEIDKIQGAFVLPQDATRPLVFIAGGIGITPYISMLRFVSQSKLPHKITLIYSNHDKKSTAFFDELSQIMKDNPNIKVIFTMTQDENWTGEKRHIDKDFLKGYIPGDLNTYAYMVSGPDKMVEEVEKTLLNSGIKEENIKKEIFSGY